MPDQTAQPAQGSTADYCSRWPGEPHHLVLSVRTNALVSVSRCSLCGWIDFDDIREQADALIAEGRRQATEGWEREWGFTYRTGGPADTCDGEADARRLAAYREGRIVVSRLVGPWEPAPCPTCSGPERETVGMVCQTCGTDYAPDDLPAEQAQDGAR